MYQKILISLVGILLVGFIPVSGKQLSKDEIKKIIFAASKQKGKYKMSAPKGSSKRKALKTASRQPAKKTVRTINPAPVAQVLPTPVKAPEEIVPIQLTPSFQNGDVKIGQKGFKLLKGEPIKKATNPLYKL